MQSRQTQVLTLQVTAASGSTPSGFRDQGRVDASDPALSFNVINFTASSRPGVWLPQDVFGRCLSCC
jgi:hypothetical protein